DLEAGSGIGFGFVGEQKIAHLLIGIGKVGAGLHANEAGEDGAGLAVERILVKQVAGGIGHLVNLEGALIDFAAGIGHGKGQHIAAAAASAQVADALAADVGAAKIGVESNGCGVPADHG